MLNIKFTGEYNKMPEDYNSSILLDVAQDYTENLSPEFIEYDTRRKDGTQYPLPDGKIIMLFLLTKKGHLWTTLRRFTQRKWEYYRSNIGNQYEIIIS